MSIRQLKVVADKGPSTNFPRMPQWGLSYTYTKTFHSKPEAQAVVDSLLKSGSKVDTAFDSYRGKTVYFVNSDKSALLF